MSATNRGAIRDERDFYRTPQWCVRAILPELPKAGTVLEPGCGDGEIVLAMLAEGMREDRIFAVELDGGLAASFRLRTGIRPHVGDFLREAMPEAGLIIGNPPFGLAQEFVERALEIVEPAKGTVCFLLRINWLGGQRRAAFHRAAPADVFVLPRRPSFGKNKDGRPGTDATEYGWFVWGPGRGGRWSILECEPARGGT